MGKKWKNIVDKKNLFYQFCIFSLGHKNWYQSTVLAPIMAEGTKAQGQRRLEDTIKQL